MKRTSHFAQVLKLKRPFRSPGHEASIALLRTASALKNGLERIARVEGISVSQFNILRILRGEGKPLPTMEVANRMVEREPGVTRLMGKLEMNGYITRSRSRSDARVVVCSVTEKGTNLLVRLDREIARFEEDLMDGLDAAALTDLIGLLSRLHGQALQSIDGPRP